MKGRVTGRKEGDHERDKDIQYLIFQHIHAHSLVCTASTMLILPTLKPAQYRSLISILRNKNHWNFLSYGHRFFPELCAHIVNCFWHILLMSTTPVLRKSILKWLYSSALRGIFTLSWWSALRT